MPFMIPSSLSDTAAFVTKAADATASQTGITLWTPTTGSRFVITTVLIACTTAGVVTLFDGTDSTTYRVAKAAMAANTSLAVHFPCNYKSSAVNNILKYTTGTFVGSIQVYGYEV